MSADAATAAQAPVRRSAPWRGRKRAPDAKEKVISVRCTDVQREMMKKSAEAAGLTVGPFLRSLALGSAGPRAVRQTPVDKIELARLLSEIGKLGSNVNQIARYANTVKELPGQRELALMQADIAAMRAAVLGALGRGD